MLRGTGFQAKSSQSCAAASTSQKPNATTGIAVATLSTLAQAVGNSKGAFKAVSFYEFHMTKNVPQKICCRGE